MKNHGYELDHNFGHGKKFLAMILAALNLLAFAWHSVLDLIETPWKAAREAAAKRTAFFADLLTLTSYVVFPSWQVFFESITTFTIPPELLKNQKIERSSAKSLLLELLGVDQLFYHLAPFELPFATTRGSWPSTSSKTSGKSN